MRICNSFDWCEQRLSWGLHQATCMQISVLVADPYILTLQQSVFVHFFKNAPKMWEVCILLPLLIIFHISKVFVVVVFPVEQTTVFYLWLVWQAAPALTETHSGTAAQRVACYVCGRQTKSETDPSFLRQGGVVTEGFDASPRPHGARRQTDGHKHTHRCLCCAPWLLLLSIVVFTRSHWLHSPSLSALLFARHFCHSNCLVFEAPYCICVELFQREE